MQDLTEDLAKVMEVVVQLELMISNPVDFGRDGIYNELIKLDNCVLGMLSKMERS